MTLKPTTVRFVPGDATSPDELAIAVLHLYAYETAKGLVSPGTRVLDIGFGEGYGSEILSDTGVEYRGLEVDPEIVEHARARYGPRFETYDGSSIPAPDGAFGLVIAFQMIAYLDDPLPLLREIPRPRPERYRALDDAKSRLSALRGATSVEPLPRT
jgi:SAM-dependent methyltransferase